MIIIRLLCHRHEIFEIAIHWNLDKIEMLWAFVSYAYFNIN